jgi:hypothetical protein
MFSASSSATNAAASAAAASQPQLNITMNITNNSGLNPTTASASPQAAIVPPTEVVAQQQEAAKIHRLVHSSTDLIDHVFKLKVVKDVISKASASFIDATQAHTKAVEQLQKFRSSCNRNNTLKLPATMHLDLMKGFYMPITEDAPHLFAEHKKQVMELQQATTLAMYNIMISQKETHITHLLKRMDATTIVAEHMKSFEATTLRQIATEYNNSHNITDPTSPYAFPIPIIKDQFMKTLIEAINQVRFKSLDSTIASQLAAAAAAKENREAEEQVVGQPIVNTIGKIVDRRMDQRLNNNNSRHNNRYNKGTKRKHTEAAAAHTYPTFTGFREYDYPHYVDGAPSSAVITEEEEASLHSSKKGKSTHNTKN